jgi:putative peptidoglycan lipid II flippase
MLTDTVTVGAFSSLAKIAGALKIVVVARYFGASDSLDAFLIAFLLPSFAANVLGGCWTSSTVPAFLKASTLHGEAAVARLARTALALSCALMGLLGLALVLAGPYLLPLFGSSFSFEKLQLTKHLFFALALWVLASACTSTWRAVLNAGGVFALPALAPAMVPVFTIFALWGLASTTGVYALSIGTVCGAVAEAVILGLAVRRRGIPLRPAWYGWTPELAAIWRQYLPLVAGSAIASASIIVDQAVAGTLGGGSVSTLAYGNKLVEVGLAITATACGAAVLPVFSRFAAAGQWKQLRRAAATYIGTVFFISVPVTVLLAWYSFPIVRLMFQGGAFGSDEARAVSVVQAYALVQVPFALAVTLVARLVVAMQVSSILARVAVIAFVSNLIGDIILAQWMGVAGIALATGLVQAVSLFTLTGWLLKRRRRVVL